VEVPEPGWVLEVFGELVQSAGMAPAFPIEALPKPTTMYAPPSPAPRSPHKSYGLWG
jgi:hypothetical protein